MTDKIEVSKFEMVDRLITTKILNNVFDYVNIEYKNKRYDCIDMQVTANTYHTQTKTFSNDFTMDIEVKSRNCFLSAYDTSLVVFFIFG
jgi:hypothetical protein